MIKERLDTFTLSSFNFEPNSSGRKGIGTVTWGQQKAIMVSLGTHNLFVKEFGGVLSQI